MSIADLPHLRWPLTCAVLLLGHTMCASAHPITQGAMDVSIAREKIVLTTRVSTEEVFVRNLFAAQSGGVSSTPLAQVWKDHGAYLLQHIRVFVDSHRLEGRVTRIVPPPAPGTDPADQLTCELEYPCDPANPAAVVRVEEDVLNELEFAPGNRWEASYVVNIGQVGGPLSRGRLLTSRDPLGFRCDWPSAAPAMTVKTPPAAR